MARMTKLEIATLLAENEYSVKIGVQTAKYWTNSFMRSYNLAQLNLLLEAATEPDPNRVRELRRAADAAATGRR